MCRFVWKSRLTTNLPPFIYTVIIKRNILRHGQHSDFWLEYVSSTILELEHFPPVNQGRQSQCASFPFRTVRLQEDCSRTEVFPSRWPSPLPAPHRVVSSPHCYTPRRPPHIPTVYVHPIPFLRYYSLASSTPFVLVCSPLCTLIPRLINPRLLCVVARLSVYP